MTFSYGLEVEKFKVSSAGVWGRSFKTRKCELVVGNQLPTTPFFKGMEFVMVECHRRWPITFHQVDSTHWLVVLMTYVDFMQSFFFLFSFVFASHIPYVQLIQGM